MTEINRFEPNQALAQNLFDLYEMPSPEERPLGFLTDKQLQIVITQEENTKVIGATIYSLGIALAVSGGINEFNSEYNLPLIAIASAAMYMGAKFYKRSSNLINHGICEAWIRSLDIRKRFLRRKLSPLNNDVGD